MPTEAGTFPSRNCSAKISPVSAQTTMSGWKRSGERSDVSLGGGGGKLDYARMREAVERTAVAAGWTFHLEGGRMP